MTRVITVTSGKGGVGKTSISVNLAIQLAKEGSSACLFDADLGLANINILLGLHPDYTLEDVITRKKTISDIIIRDVSGIDIVPGSTGIDALADLDADRLKGLITEFSILDPYDFLLFDTSAGISQNVISFCMASSEVILVLIPEPTSLTDGYSLLKVLSLNGFKHRIQVVVNQSKNDRKGKIVFDKFQNTVQKYLPLNIHHMGTILQDESVVESVTMQKPFISLYPKAKASLGIRGIIRKIIDEKTLPGIDETQGFWHQYMKFVKSPIQLTAPKKTTVQKKSNYNKTVEDLNVKKPVKEKSVTPYPQYPLFQSKDTDIQADIIANPYGDKILDSLNQLVDAVSSISGELGEIRHAIDKTQPIKGQAETLSTQRYDKKGMPIISLDFEAFVERTKKKTNNS